MLTTPLKDLPVTGVLVNVQIQWCIIRQILGEILKPGDTLGTILEMADQFAVNQNTIQKAMGVLASNGIIDSSRGRSSTVSKKAPDICYDLQTKAIDEFNATFGTTLED